MKYIFIVYLSDIAYVNNHPKNVLVMHVFEI
jgi:hypothetical protein